LTVRLAVRVESVAWSHDPVEILRVVYPALVQTARRIGSQGARDPRDLVHDALVEVLARHPDFVGIERPLGYAKTVLLRLAYAGRRRAGREVPLDLQEHLERLALPDHQDAVARRIAIDRGMASLGRRQRACVHLRFVEGLETREIADVLGCADSTVRSQLARALRHLRLTLDDEPDRDSPTAAGAPLRGKARNSEQRSER
jgi:RNA polymerase sigma factor (sigma-70 family)